MKLKSIGTAKSQEEIIRILRENTDAGKLSKFNFNAPAKGKDYKGEIRGDSFRIAEVIRSHNRGYANLLPVIEGRIEETDGCARVYIRMKMHPSAVVLTVACFCVCAGFCILTALARPLEGSVIPAAVIALVMGVFFPGLIIFVFRYASVKAKKKLEKLFSEGAEEKPYKVR